MRAYVYTDKSLERYAGRFVWLSINTENAKNAEFVGKYTIAALPTLLVIDPVREEVTLQYVGGATAGQLTKLLDDARTGSRGGADTTLAAADKLAAAGKQEEAAGLYATALQQAPKNWRRYNRAAESLVLALSLTGKTEECVKRARALYPTLKGTTSGATVAAAGLDCSQGLDGLLEKATRESFDHPGLDISADDRSGLYISLIGAREAAKDEEGARKLREEWAAFLESTAAKAKTPGQRTVYDSHRLSAYLELKRPEKAIAMLEQSARDFPDDYNPHARMAIAYRSMKKYDQALTASDRALRLAYGPRKLGILRTRSDIHAGMGNKKEARTTIRDAIAYAKSLPKEQQRASTIAALETKLKELE